MRKIVFAMLLLGARGTLAADWAEWVVTNHNEAITMYADTATIRSNGGLARMWDLTDFEKGNVLGADKRSLSFKREQEYDCNGQRARILYISWHSEHMGEGQILGSERSSGSWRPVLVGTVLERLWRTACDK